jgi:hypothetical protein
MLTIDNKEEIEGFVDPGSQIIAMAKGVCCKGNLTNLRR